MFECWWQHEGFEAWRLRGDLRGASRRWQHRLQDELWVWLNGCGEGAVWGREHRIFLKEGMVGYFGGQEGEAWKWTRLPGRHEAEILVIPRAYLMARFGTQAVGLRTAFARWLRGEQGISYAGLGGAEEERLREQLAAGWPTRGLPGQVEELLDCWLNRLLGAKATEVKAKKSQMSRLGNRRGERRAKGSCRSEGGLTPSGREGS